MKRLRADKRLAFHNLCWAFGAIKGVPAWADDFQYYQLIGWMK